MGNLNSDPILKVGNSQGGDAYPVPPPKHLIRVSIYKQPPGCHPGGKVGERNPQLRRHSYITRGIELVELVIGGRGWVMIDGALQEVTPGALLWHVEGDPVISRSDWDNPYSCLAVPFETEPYQGVRRAAHLSWWRELDEVQRFCSQLLTSYLDSHFDRDLLCQYAYSRLLFQSRTCGQSGANAGLPEKLRKALELMTRQDAKAFSVGGVARQVGWSLPHLHQVFRDELGTTPHQFIMERRIKVAKDQLATTDFPIKKIALDCGFATPAAFCHAFRQRTGVTPLHYRRQEVGRLHTDLPVE